MARKHILSTSLDDETRARLERIRGVTGGTKAMVAFNLLRLGLEAAEQRFADRLNDAAPKTDAWGNPL